MSMAERPNAKAATVSSYKAPLLRLLTKTVNKPYICLGPSVHRQRSGSHSNHSGPPVCEELLRGIHLLRVTRKKIKSRAFTLDIATGFVILDGKHYKFCVDSIKDIRSAGNARNYRELCKISAEHEPLWLSVIYAEGVKLKAMHIIMPSSQMLEKFQKSLERLYDHRIDLVGEMGLLGNEQSASLGQVWHDGESNVDASLSFDQVEKLCRGLHIHASTPYLKKQFDQVDEDSSGHLTFAAFQKFVKLLKHREDIEMIYNLHKNSEVDMNRDAFGKFLREIQGFKDDAKAADKIFNKYRTEADMISYDGFVTFLLSYQNLPLTQADNDMTKPLNEYFISSSHNTYLTGRQVGDESSIEGYIRALQRGCRCVEIDIWDGPGGMPTVQHGRAFTSKIPFEDVIQTIDKYAFIVSSYPLILSLEIRCSEECQRIVAHILLKDLGEALLTERLRNDDTLPSPEELRHRILIKVKHSSGNIGMDEKSDASTSEVSTAESDSSLMAHAHNPTKPNTSGKVIRLLIDMAPYCIGLKFRNFSLPESKTFSHVFSFSEKSFHRLSDTYQIEKHNTKFLMRVYPSNLRINSTNFLPHLYWCKGVQLVALNWQTYDLGIQLNDALFSPEDVCGYVLKPDSVRLYPNCLQQPKRTYQIKIISGQQLPKPCTTSGRMSPYVEIEIIRPSKDDIIRKKTSSVEDNGFNPSWNEVFTFSSTWDPCFTFVRLTVRDSETNTAMALFSLQLSRLQRGYRHIPLYDLSGEQYIFSTLFIYSL